MKTTRKGTVIALKGLCDHAIRKHNLIYPNNVSSSNKERKQFDVLAVPCDRAFVVSPEKVEEFKNSRPNRGVRQQNEEMVNKLRINNLVEEGPVLKKTRKTK